MYVCVYAFHLHFVMEPKVSKCIKVFVTTITFAVLKSFRISNSAKKLMENTFHKGTRLSLCNLVYLHFYFLSILSFIQWYSMKMSCEKESVCNIKRYIKRSGNPARMNCNYILLRIFQMSATKMLKQKKKRKKEKNK